MFKYSVILTLTMCFTLIRAPDIVRDVVKQQEFEDWGCEDICNEANKIRIANLCVKLSSTQAPLTAQFIRSNSSCISRFMKLTSKETGNPGYFSKTVGFCDMGLNQFEKKCITTSQESNNMLVWDWSGELGSEYCEPKYEKEGWLVPNAEYNQ